MERRRAVLHFRVAQSFPSSPRTRSKTSYILPIVETIRTAAVTFPILGSIAETTIGITSVVQVGHCH